MIVHQPGRAAWSASSLTALRGNQPGPPRDLGLVASGTVRPYVSVVEVTQSRSVCGFRYSGSRTLTLTSGAVWWGLKEEACVSACAQVF